jgi:hypothetical protein
MPGDKVPTVCPECGGHTANAPLLGCRSRFRHLKQFPDDKPGKGQSPPYVAEAVNAIEPDDDDEEERNVPWQPR